MIREGLIRPKLIPNMITLLRAVLALFFFIVTPFTALFYLIYVVCALTDMLDGFLARRLHSVTTFGQSLDSVADFIFFAAVSSRIVPLLNFEPWMLIWAGIIFVIKLSSVVIGFQKFGEYASLHTYGNKFTGLLLFVYPAFIGWVGMQVPTLAVCVVATITAIEEQIILLKLKKLHRDIKGLFGVKKL